MGLSKKIQELNRRVTEIERLRGLDLQAKERELIALSKLIEKYERTIWDRIKQYFTKQ